MHCGGSLGTTLPVELDSYIEQFGIPRTRRPPPAHWTHGLQPSSLKHVKRSGPLCGVQRELGGVSPQGSFQWGNNFHATLVCKGCFSTVSMKLCVEFEWTLKDTRRGTWGRGSCTSAWPCVLGSKENVTIRRQT